MCVVGGGVAYKVCLPKVCVLSTNRAACDSSRGATILVTLGKWLAAWLLFWIITHPIVLSCAVEENTMGLIWSFFFFCGRERRFSLARVFGGNSYRESSWRKQ